MTEQASPSRKIRPEFRNINAFNDLPGYRWPLAALVSGMHRASGAILFLLMPFIIWMFDNSISSEISFAKFKDAFDVGMLGLPGVLWKLIALAFWLEAHRCGRALWSARLVGSKGNRRADGAFYLAGFGSGHIQQRPYWLRQMGWHLCRAMDEGIDLRRHHRPALPCLAGHARAVHGLHQAGRTATFNAGSRHGLARGLRRLGHSGALASVKHAFD